MENNKKPNTPKQQPQKELDFTKLTNLSVKLSKVIASFPLDKRILFLNTTRAQKKTRDKLNLLAADFHNAIIEEIIETIKEDGNVKDDFFIEIYESTDRQVDLNDFEKLIEKTFFYIDGHSKKYLK